MVFSAVGLVVELVAQAQVAGQAGAVELAGVDGGLHRTAGLDAVAAVTEAASGGEIADVGEHPLDGALGIP